MKSYVTIVLKTPAGDVRTAFKSQGAESVIADLIASYLADGKTFVVEQA
jgi:hypothetical protein